jgi:PhnB protein
MLSVSFGRDSSRGSPEQFGEVVCWRETVKVTPYVSFNGNCEEAVLFYRSVLGGAAHFMRYSDLPADAGMPVGDFWKSKIMHGSLVLDGGVEIYFGDAWEGSRVEIGSNNTMHLNVDSEEEVSRIVDGLSEGGEITMPAGRMFWGSAYGSLVDRFGVHWGVEYELPKAPGE